MTKHILITLIALFIAAPSAAQAGPCWPVRCASTQASTKPGLKKVELPDQAKQGQDQGQGQGQEEVEEQEEEVWVDDYEDKAAP